MKILIVDDDFPVRMLLKQLINWEEEGFSLIGEAIDGQEGLEKVESLAPDLVIVDIEMPRLNGVEMIQQLQANQYKGAILVLSCHDDFTYVKEALKLGARDYLLKDHLTSEKLVEVLHVMKQHYLHEKKEQQQQNQLKRWANKGRHQLKQEYLKNILLNINQNFRDINKKLQELEMFIGRKENGLMVIKIYHYENQITKISVKKDRELFNFTLFNIMDEVMKDLRLEGEVVGFNNHYFALVINLDQILSSYKQEQILFLLGQRIRDSLKKYLDMSINVLFQEQIKELRQLGVTHQKLRQQSRSFFYQVPGSVTHYLQLPHCILDKNVSSEEDNKKLKEWVNEGNQQALENHIQSRLQLCQREKIDPVIVKNLAMDWYEVFRTILNQHQMELDQVLEEEGFEPNLHLIAETMEEVKEDLFQIIGVVCSCLKVELRSSNSLVNAMLTYIQGHYMEDITLYHVAEHVKKNTSYVSHLFKQEMKESFTDYMKKIRIERAKELILEEHLKINQIASMVGIPNRKYFTKIFKERAGMSPSDYKMGKR